MKEVLVAKLDKDDLARSKELEQSYNEAELLVAKVKSQRTAFWEGLRLKHMLLPGNTYYIKGKAIYNQEI